MNIVTQQTITWTLKLRRWTALLTTAIVFLFWIFGAYLTSVSLGHVGIYSGVTLLICLSGLCLIGVRRRIPVLPIGKVSTWVQVHIYTGLFATAVYVVHVPKIIAGGSFEGPLSALFVLVTASGFYGIYASRTAPRRLTLVPTQFRFDQIPWHRNKTFEAAEGTIATMTESPDLLILKSYYQLSIRPYLQAPLSLRYFVYPTATAKRNLLAGMNDLDRYFDSPARAVASKLASLVRFRDDLNYQHAIQLRLRLWVVMHSCLSLVLVVWSLVHAWVAIGMIGS